METRHRIKIQGYTFCFMSNSDDADGVVINPDQVSIDDPGYLDSLYFIFDHYPEIKRYIVLKRMIYHYPDIASRRGDYLDSLRQAIGEVEQDGLFEVPERAYRLCASIIEALLSESEKDEKPPKRHPGFVYLLQSPTGSYKIGRTSDPDNRLKTFEVKLPFEVEYICVIPTDCMWQLEGELHARFEAKRVNGEWFDLDADDVAHIKSLAEVAS